MTDLAPPNSPWRDDELDLIVAEYFAMLALEQSGAPYVKARHAERLMALTGRSHRSVEFKLMNISAVLEQELALPRIRGYRPMDNYQAAIFPAIERYLTANPAVLAAAQAPAAPDWPQAAEVPVLFVEAPPPLLVKPRKPRPEGLERLVRKFDPVERDFRNRALGRAGEELVLHAERRRLADHGAHALADAVRWVADLDGDGAGYDILSFEPDGRRRLIEVKTTTGVATTPFFLTRNEEAFAREKADEFRLARVYDFSRGPRMFELTPPLADHVVLETETWRAGFASPR
ncbi:MAG: DUF3883 domain-containing protein [Caulobacter sp.]|nr:DUF3883 domain-containing protein [Caulobacter sp.]